MTYKYGILLAFLPCFFRVEAIDNTADEQLLLKEKVTQAITKLEQTTRKNWAYQISRYENEEGDITSSIENYNPRLALEQRWTLLQIDGENPSAVQMKKFQKRKNKEREDKKVGASYSISLREIIQLESVTLAGESPAHITMNFDVLLKKLGEDAIGKLHGTLLYNKQHRFIEQIIIENNAEFSPMFTAKVTELKLTFGFININDNVLPLKQDMEMVGSFAYFTEINETSTDSYSGYEYYDQH